MSRPIRLVLASVVLVALAAGTAVAVQQPSADAPRSLAQDGEADALTPEAAQALVDRLAAAGLQTDVATLTALAADHGVGGAVRILGWSQTADPAVTVDDIVTRRADGMGWGQIAKELGTHPGIGRWMRGGNGPADDAAADEAGEGNGRGRDTAPGQAKNRP